MSDRTGVDDTAHHRARLVVVEQGLQELKTTVQDLAKSINQYISEQAKAPRPIPFKEIIATAAATLALVGMVMNMFDARVERAVELSASRMKQEAILQQYRLERLEKSPIK